ncbi:g9863 [Coccomyxa viridis]|uniref:G9863 protein n=1 Tax=Coccomyxa viridis TaxID=1274662 RepID=A0ABP1G4C1_9CHLO
MVKRKQPSAPSFPSEVHLQPATRSTSAANGTGPFVVYFASGYCPGNDESLHFEHYKNVDRPREHRLVLQKDRVAFVGSTADAEGPPACRYAMGLLDKRSGVMKYAEVNGGSIVRMEPRAAGTNYGPTGHKTELEETAQARKAHNERLVHAFGSTRRQRQLKDRDQAQVVDENIEASDAVKELLNAAGEKAVQTNATKAKKMEEAAGDRKLPKHDLKAMTAAHAYRLEDMVPRGAWEAIQDVSSLERAIEDLEFRDNELRAENRVPGYVLDRLAVITQPRSQTGARRLRALAFLAALIQLYDQKRQLRPKAREGVGALAHQLQIQADLLQSLLDKFYHMEETEEGRRAYSRTGEQQTSLLLHLLMTALIAEDYNMGGRQFEALQATLKLPSDDIVKYYREMGCTIDRARADPADRAASPMSPQKQFRVRLLPEGLPGMPAKTLADAIPGLRIPRQPKKR